MCRFNHVEVSSRILVFLRGNNIKQSVTLMQMKQHYHNYIEGKTIRRGRGGGKVPQQQGQSNS